jgi:presequence protease
MTEKWQSGLKLHGFQVRDHTPLPELNAAMIRLDHLRTGARYVHLATEDDNNLFGVGFRTTPKDSTGVAHILEHTVLCGSRRFPVRDPFFAMIKRSLNTFMNALTSSDWTLYPFSSQNEKDFYNLMEIYLDATFFPLLRERDFHQEGHRVEFADPGDPSSPLIFKGVVYNEMKGAMADPSSLISRRMARALYPTTTYGHNSGGEPEDILDLTWESLREFHATHYHPANAYFFTYGNFPLENHLKRIEDLALSQFESRQIDTAVADEIRFSAPKQVTETYPVDRGESLESRSMVQVGWLTCPVADSFERTALSLLSTLLLGNSAAPLHKALLDSRLGRNLAPGTGYHDDNRDTYFAAGLQGTNPEATEEIEKLILATLEEAAAAGFSPQRIEAAIHQLEFAHREVTGDQYPYSLILLMRIMGPWLHHDDPLSPLLLQQDLARLRHELENGPFFQNLIRKYLLDNRHRATLLLRPDPEQKEREEQETAVRLERLAGRMTAEDRQEVIRRSEELRKAQETQEDLSVLPTLEISDIPAAERPVPFDQVETSGKTVFRFAQPTNGIGYFIAGLDGAEIPDELRPYVPLFCTMLTQIGAAGQTYLDMAERISAFTGGVRAGAVVQDDPHDLGQFRSAVEFKGKALIRNQKSMYEIIADYFRSPDFTDFPRLNTVLNQWRVSLENSIPASGHSYASRAAGSRLTPAGQRREEWGGLTLVRKVREAAEIPSENLGDVAGKMQTLADLFLTRGRIHCAVTAEKDSFAAVEDGLGTFLKAAAGRRYGGDRDIMPFAPQPQGTGWATSVPVSYTARVFRTVPFDHPDSAGLMVLAKLLRAGFLHREIREKGGAYGGMAGCDPEAGIFSMLSYRDPNMVRTLQVYRDAVHWATAGSFGDEEIKEAVLAVFSGLDRPLSPGGRGNREFWHHLQGITPDLRRQFRERVLETGRHTLMDLAGRYLQEGWQQSAVAVVAGEEALRKANEELGEEALAIERI